MSCKQCIKLETMAIEFSDERTYFKDTVAVCVASMERLKKLRLRDRNILNDAMDELAAVKKELETMKQHAAAAKQRLETVERELTALRATTKK